MAQNQPKETDILKLITISLFDHYKEYLENNRTATKAQTLEDEKNNTAIKGVTIFLMMLVPLFIIWKNNYLSFINSSLLKHLAVDHAGMLTLINIALYGLIGSFFMFLYFLLSDTVIHFYKIKFKEKKDNHVDSAYNRIKWLMERCHSNVSEEFSNAEDSNLQGMVNIVFGKQKKTKAYTTANAKEIEYELHRFLEKARKEELEFILVFDELDKVDPAISKSYADDEHEGLQKITSDNTYQNELRDRKQAIINIISGLKNFFTTAEARFIFIAGREMFDASLADIADRQSSISSIFTYIFNIESLLKEKDEVNNGNEIGTAAISAVIENYLSIIIFDDSKRRVLDAFKENRKIAYGVSLDDGHEKIKLSQSDKSVYFMIQNFITYLTYRSNGSPKKMIRVIQEFIKIIPPSQRSEQTISFNGNQEAKFLNFSYHNQYRINFISYLYRPFLIQYGRSFKLFSDNIIVSTPYLFDHLLKFHPFAFSLSNLELVPEMLSANKTPSLRDHIRQLVDYLGANHIRETEIELFDYKFFSRTLNEITFLSKVFEEEAAAYNFMLDEAYLVKLLIRSKIKELRNVYANSPSQKNSSQQIFSIAHLNGKVGDLHFFDQEYDDAILSYSDAIRSINNLEVEHINLRDFVNLIRNKLKLGLCFEKINSYDEALSFYSDACHDARRFMAYQLKNEIKPSQQQTEAKPSPEQNEVKESQEQDADKSGSFDKHTIFTTPSLNDVLQIINQAFLATIIIQEKMGLEGISGPKLAISVGSFFKMIEGVEKYSSRNNQVAANFYIICGKLLYFKNSPDGLKDEKNVKNALSEDVYDLFTKLIGKIEGNPLLQFDDGYRKPVLAFYMYLLSLNETISSRMKEIQFIERYDQKNNFVSYLLNIMSWMLDSKNKFPNIGNEKVKHQTYLFTGIHYRQIAVTLSNIGDCLLSMLKVPGGAASEEKFKSFTIDQIFDAKKCLKRRTPDEFDQILIPSEDNWSITDVLRCYYLSGQYFTRFGKSMSCSYQYRKILYVLRLVLKYDQGNYDKNKQFIAALEKTIVKPVLEITSLNTGHSDRHMQEKPGEYDMEPEEIAAQLSNSPETQEIVLLFNYIRIKLAEKVTYKGNICGTQYVRLLELDFHAKNSDLKMKDNKKLPPAELLEALTNYMYCMLTILQILKIYGTDYMIGPSYLAYTHYRLAETLNEFERASPKHNKRETKNFNISKPEIYDYLDKNLRLNIENLLGKGSYSSFDMIYHYRMARDLYGKTVQLHQAGNEYKKALQNMIYLEDDFSDNAYHFGAALDRYKLINGGLTYRIQKCNDEIKKRPFKYYTLQKDAKVDTATSGADIGAKKNKVIKKGSAD